MSGMVKTAATHLLTLLAGKTALISIDPWMFVLPALMILVIAFVTISTQTIKAASANPVKSLRTE